ncbi:putative protein isoform X3 [Capsicum chacoense]
MMTQLDIMIKFIRRLLIHHRSRHDQVHSSPFDLSPFTPGSSSMPESHYFSTYVAPAWVDEPNPQSYYYMPSRDLTCTLCLSFGSAEFGDVATQDLVCTTSSIPVQTPEMISKTITELSSDTQIPDLAPSVGQDASHGPVDVMEETRVSARMKNRKSKHCADPVAAIKRRDNRDGYYDVHGGLRPRESILFRSCGTYLFVMITISPEVLLKKVCRNIMQCSPRKSSSRLVSTRKVLDSAKVTGDIGYKPIKDLKRKREVNKEITKQVLPERSTVKPKSKVLGIQTRAQTG